MKTEIISIERRSFTGRMAVPVSLSLIVWVLIFAITLNLDRIGNTTVYRFFMNASHTLLFVWVGFSGALFVYPVMYFRGASLAERVIGTYAVPLAFIVKEVYRVSEFFTIGESFYYAVSSTLLLLILGQVGLMGISEMTCRKTRNKKAVEKDPVLTLIPSLCILFSLVWLYILLIWGLGVHWFYIYQEGYKALFL